ncbi:MAG: glutamate formimidoyltransferase [Gemmatimonadota bacterium]
MIGKLLCEPNVSEGRDDGRIAAFAAAVRDTPHVDLIHCSADPDHNRMVLAYLGPPAAVVEATERLADAVFERLDLREHDGQHPRIGALDVVPFVADAPAGSDAHGVALSACRAFGEWVGEQGIPLFYYEDAATAAHRRPLPEIRRGGFEGLEARMAKSEWIPDAGPAAPHPRLGAVITGVRRPLVRFNVNLSTPDPRVAREIAAIVRASTGGLPAVRALGLALRRRGASQVTMNLTDYRETSVASAYAAVVAAAAELGEEIIGTEVIGPIPRAALDGVEAHIMESLDPNQIRHDL